MSHNSKYYRQKIKKKDAEGVSKISSFFKPNTNVGDDEKCENPTESQTIEMPHRSTEEDTKHRSSEEKIEAVTSSSKESMQASAFSLQQFQPKEEGTKVSYSDTVTLQSFDKRKFSAQKYESQYSWLYFSHVKKGFLCKYCELFGVSSSVSPFINKGVDLGTHPTRTLDTHNESKCHKFAVERYSLCKTNTNVYRQLKIQDQVTQGKEVKNKEAVKKIFKCVDFLTRQKLAVSENTEKFVKFVAGLGDNDLQNHLNDSTQKTKYLSSNSVTQIINTISNFHEQELLADMRDKEFALLADESTDMANRSQLSVMARFSRSDNTISTHFLGFVNLDKGTSEAVMEALKSFLLAKGIEIGKVRFVALDGCNTMSGEHKGLQRRIRHESPFSLYINCRNHRLALCLAHLIKKYPILQEIDASLLSLWKLFEFSPQKMAVFKNMQSVYGKEPLTILRAATTRWLSHLHASARFVSRYTCILDTLDAIYDEKKDPEILGIRFNVTKKPLLAGIVLLCDILKPVNMLSLYLQEQDINFTTLPMHVKETTDILHELIGKYQENQLDETEFLKVRDLFTEINDRTDLARRMRDRDRDEMTPETFLGRIGIPLIYDLIQEIEDAFCTGAPVLSSFGVLDPRNLPDTVEKLSDYGQDEIQKIADFYGSPKDDAFQGHRIQVRALFDSVALRTELTSFKRHLYMLR
ncbi:zinc finger MYM-type protein 1-like [Crassostrea virginica]